MADDSKLPPELQRKEHETALQHIRRLVKESARLNKEQRREQRDRWRKERQEVAAFNPPDTRAPWQKKHDTLARNLEQKREEWDAAAKKLRAEGKDEFWILETLGARP